MGNVGLGENTGDVPVVRQPQKIKHHPSGSKDDNRLSNCTAHVGSGSANIIVYDDGNIFMAIDVDCGIDPKAMQSAAFNEGRYRSKGREEGESKPNDARGTVEYSCSRKGHDSCSITLAANYPQDPQNSWIAMQKALVAFPNSNLVPAELRGFLGNMTLQELIDNNDNLQMHPSSVLMYEFTASLNDGALQQFYTFYNSQGTPNGDASEFDALVRQEYNNQPVGVNNEGVRKSIDWRRECTRLAGLSDAEFEAAMKSVAEQPESAEERAPLVLRDATIERALGFKDLFPHGIPGMIMKGFFDEATNFKRRAEAFLIEGAKLLAAAASNPAQDKLFQTAIRALVSGFDDNERAARIYGYIMDNEPDEDRIPLEVINYFPLLQSRFDMIKSICKQAEIMHMICCATGDYDLDERYAVGSHFAVQRIYDECRTFYDEIRESGLTVEWITDGLSDIVVEHLKVKDIIRDAGALKHLSIVDRRRTPAYRPRAFSPEEMCIEDQLSYYLENEDDANAERVAKQLMDRKRTDPLNLRTHMDYDLAGLVLN